MSFILRKDTGNIPVAGYQDSPDAIDVLLWAPLKIIDETKDTDVNGDFTANNKPFLDVSRDQERVINGYDITAKKVADSAPLYIKADGSATWPKDGKVRLYTDPGYTAVFANSSAKVTYWTLVAIKVNDDGQFEIINTNLNNLDTAIGAKTDTEVTSGDASVIAMLKNLRTRLGNLETYTDGLEGQLTNIISTDGVKKITDNVKVAKIDGTTEVVAGVETRLGEVQDVPTVYTVLARLKALEGYVDGLETTLTAIKDTDGVKKITDAVTVQRPDLGGFNHVNVDVTTTSAVAIIMNGATKWISFINDSDTAIYIAMGEAAVLNYGIRLNAGGSSFEMSKILGNLRITTVYAIHGGTSTKRLLINWGS